MAESDKSRVLTHLRFKNWRSLKDVEIDLAPITVIIGANASGKTNILDALHFLRYAITDGVIEAVYNWRGFENIRTIGVDEEERVELSYSFSTTSGKALTYKLDLHVDDSKSPHIWFQENVPQSENRVSMNVSSGDMQRARKLKEELREEHPSEENSTQRIGIVLQFVQRWQLLDEGFMPNLSVKTGGLGDLYSIERKANNTAYILDFMRKIAPDIYENLQNDISWLLKYVDKLDTEQTESETRFLIKEKAHGGHEAPTISAGTARIIAMLTAYYALDMRFPDQPGLVVIEEPDTALNPWLLQNFVEQLRNYVEGEHPRQFILTTHNPAFLNYFKREEVRVVERDEQGFTHVNEIPKEIEDIWRDKYGLGEVWTTGSFGGVPG